MNDSFWTRPWRQERRFWRFPWVGVAVVAAYLILTGALGDGCGEQPRYAYPPLDDPCLVHHNCERSQRAR